MSEQTTPDAAARDRELAHEWATRILPDMRWSDRAHAADSVLHNATPPPSLKTLADMTPQIIRTREELAALDPDTLLFPAYQFTNGWESCHQKCVFRAVAAHRLDLTFHGPVVVIATGDQVRATQQALEEK